MSALFRAWHLVLWLSLLEGSTRVRGLGVPSTTNAGTAAGAGANQASYFYTEPGGSYSFAYKTDNGMERQQSANQANEVTGHYSFYENGVPYLVKYTAGVNGYRPQIFVGSNAAAAAGAPLAATSFTAAATLAPPAAALNVAQSQPLQLSFGNSLSAPNGFVASNLSPLAAFTGSSSGGSAPTTSNNNNNQNAIQPPPLNEYNNEPHPYSFSYSSDLSTHSESGDKDGNVVGKYSYLDRAGYHDLSYKADAEGFTVLGGSLATTPPAPAPAPQPPAPGIYNFNMAPALTKSSLLTSPAVAAASAGEKNLKRRSLRKFRRYSNW